MKDDAFSTREQALEGQFFRSVDKALVDQMRDELASKTNREKLSHATGISNDQLLDELLTAGVGPATLVAFLLLPLAEVAWADGKVDKKEYGVVLNTALALGCREDGPGMGLLRRWLEDAPEDALFDIWCEYASELVSRLSQRTRSKLAATIIQRAEAVAEATGGFLGVHRTSADERTVIERIKAALSAPAGRKV